MRWSACDPSFLLTSDDALPDFAFHGSCFVGHDFISGAGGAAAYRRQGGDVGIGEDGSYAVLRRGYDSSWTLGTDYKGFTHVFYFSDPGRHWAVSNSFTALLRHLRSSGIDPSADPAPVAAFAANRDLVRTLMSYRTPLQGVRLLPSRATLWLRPGASPSLTEVPVVATSGTTPSYEVALAQFLETWTARFATLVSDPRLRLILHVTGGRDSRTVLAIMLSALRHVGRDVPAHLSFVSTPHRIDDVRIASALAANYDFDLNPPSAPPVRPPGPRAAFRAWEEMCVGCYSHTMFPIRLRDSRTITLPGVGGESHRRTYRPTIATLPIADIAQGLRDGFRSPDAFASWRDSLLEADEYLAAGPDAHPVPMVRSHREFRDRFHSGKENFYTTAALALAGRHLVACSNALPETEFDESQVLFDVMHNTAPGLMDMPYDDASKEPSTLNRRRLHSLAWSASVAPGEVFIDDAPCREPAEAAGTSTPLSHMLAGAAGVLHNRAALDLLDRGMLEDGIDVLRRNVDAERQNLHHRGRTAHLAYLANLVM